MESEKGQSVEDNFTHKRNRSPAFPYIDLKASIELCEKFNTAARGSEVRLEDIATVWGMTAKSGSFGRYMAALSAFGLVDTSGTGLTRRAKISNIGRRILEDGRPGVYEGLTKEAALKPNIIRLLYEGNDERDGWGHARPDDAMAVSSLKFDLGFTQDAATRLLSVYDETIRFVKDTPLKLPPVLPRESSPAQPSLPPVSDIAPTATAITPKAFYGGGDEAQTTSQNSEPGEAKLNDIHIEIVGGKVRVSALLDIEGLQKLKKNIAALEMLLATD